VAATPTRIVLIRHAEPDEAVRGRCYGRLDVELSPRGIEHAARLGRQLAAHRIAAVYSSPLRRALGTAAPISAALGLDLVLAAELAEIDCGKLEGATWEEIERTYPGFFFWSSVPAGFEFPGGESYADLAARASRALEDIRARHPGETVVAVTHAGVLRSVLARLLSMPESEMFRLGVSHGGVTVVDWLDAAPVVRQLNGESLPASL
jgi:alpha-ribazole phosphatase/probable phosphoglycerate mutase